MKSLIILSLLAIAIPAYGFRVRRDTGDKEMFLYIIKCAQDAAITGIPEIDLPSHDPLKIKESFNTTVDLGNYSVAIAMDNMVMEGIPWWNVTQMDDVSEVEGNPVFNYAIYWKMMNFEGEWKIAVTNTNAEDPIYEKDGIFGFEFDHLTFSGLFNFTKPTDEEAGTFNIITLGLHTEEAKFKFDDLGIASNIIDFVGAATLKEIINNNLDASVLGAGIKNKLNRDWLNKPERIQALIDHCGTNTF